MFRIRNLYPITVSKIATIGVSSVSDNSLVISANNAIICYAQTATQHKSIIGTIRRLTSYLIWDQVLQIVCALKCHHYLGFQGVDYMYLPEITAFSNGLAFAVIPKQREREN
ncbi:MAG: hypothetical protein A3F16_06880 [Deltaproteobacteria bacterium RIFCSPHIGHO2_12_FULL_43_9]|nr:MAG: hypothetical protein A3F16_06880 [Deltaproteobacteria bacterium RIFCSPHIGHO2_12_FULL_43_9]